MRAVHSIATVRDFTSTDMLVCAPATSLAEAAARMHAQACSSILVMEGGRPVGIFTERDVMRLNLADTRVFDTPIGAVMHAPLHAISADLPADAAVTRMREAGVRHLLVTEADGQPWGIVTQTDLALRHGVDRFLRLRLVEELDLPTPLRLPGDLPAAAAAARMAALECEAALVQGDDGGLGIVTERDVLTLLAKRLAGASLAAVASFPLRTVPAQASLLEARRLLVEQHIRHLGVTNAQGAVTGLLSLRDLLAVLGQRYAADLAELLRQREEALQHSHADLMLAQQVIDSSQNAVLVVGADGRIISANPAFARLTGHAVDAAVGAVPDALLACDTGGEGDLCAVLCARATREGGARAELWCQRKDGARRAFSFSVHALRQAGQPTGQHALVFHDVTERLFAQEALRRSEARYRALVENLPLGITVMDRGYRIQYTNPAFDALMGKPPGWFVGRLCYAEYEKRDRPCSHCPGAQAMYGKTAADVETSGVRDDGRRIEVRNRAIPQLDADGEVTGFIEIVEDITERKRAEASLRLAASVFTHAREGILITDAKGRILEVNEAFCRITGYSRAEMLGRSPGRLRSGRHGREFYAEMWRALRENGHWSGELWNRRKDGSEYAEYLTISAVRDETGQTMHYVGLFSDITAQKLHELELQRVAHYDALTGLPNRALLADRMHQAQAHSRRSGEILAVCLMDLDGFKPVNDRFGHKAGDMLLREIARRLQAAIREEDTAARLGGDEFVLLLGGFHDASHYEATLRRVLASVAQPVLVEGQPVQVTASIGVTLFPTDAADADQLLRHADQAMYQAKMAGKGVFRLFNPCAESRLRATRALLGAIESAIAQGEFELYYQPKVDCRAGRVVGVEALLRWNHPVLGLRAPAEFLPLIEEDTLIVRLGEWVIATALAQQAAWRQAGLDLSVSVNIAARHFMQGDLAGFLTQTMANTPPEATRGFVIELVETAALEDVQAVRALMDRFQPLGVQFALDDFGTGYSTLLHLKQLPADELKIDRTFIHDMFDDSGDLAIVDGIVGLARAFGRRAVAEGVESIEQILMLLELACDIVQGHAIASPMPAAQLTRWLKTFQPDPRWRLAGQDYPLRADFELLLLEVGHRHWFERILREPFLPAAALERCPFEGWLAAQARRKGRARADLRALERTHHHVHVQAEALAAAGRQSEAAKQARAALEAAHAEFMQRLRALRAHWCARSQRSRRKP